MASWGSQRSGRGRMTTEDMLDNENQRMAEHLSGNVSRLKSLAFDIENDVKSSNQYMDGVGDDMGSSTGLLTGSMTRLSNMVGSSKNNRKLMCYIILILVGLFIFVYYILSWITAK